MKVTDAKNRKAGELFFFFSLSIVFKQDSKKVVHQRIKFIEFTGYESQINKMQ